jgi:hypothetical protein
MKKLLFILFAAISGSVLLSCSESIMDDINKDVNNPTDMPSRLIITDAMVNTAFSTTGGDFALYASLYIEHNVGIWDQFFQAEIRTTGPTSSTTYNNSWGSIYANLYALKKIITKCSDGGSESGNYHTLGIAEILTAFNLSYLTDGMGDIPWSNALQPGKNNSPVSDTQESIYTEIFRLLDDAILNLEKTSVYPSLGSQDPLYNGDLALWKKFAYGLQARYTMRLSYRDPDYNSVITLADQSFSSSSEQAQFNYNGGSTNSPFYRFFLDRDYYGASQSLHNKLDERNDPRDNVFFMPYPGTGSTLVFAPNGSPNQMQGMYSVSGISTSTAPTYLLSYHELQFLKAEAYARLNNLALADTALRKGLTAAFGKVNVNLSATQALNYMNTSVRPRFNLDPISEIMNQKYLAFFEEEAMEAYNDYRRLKAMGDDVIELENPLNANMFPLRFSYGSGDVTTNENIRNAYGDGTYVYNENVWWAGGTR